MNKPTFADFATLLKVTPTTDTHRICVRLVGIGLGVTCGRCGGSGRYSYNQITGDVCFGCGGSGVKAPKPTAATYAAAESAVAEGKLDAYFQRCARRKRARKFTEGRSFEPLSLRKRYVNNNVELSDSWTQLAVTCEIAWNKAWQTLQEAAAKLRKTGADADVVLVEQAAAALDAVVEEHKAKALAHPDFCAARLYRPQDKIWDGVFARRFLAVVRLPNRNLAQYAFGARDLDDARGFAEYGCRVELITELFPATE